MTAVIEIQRVFIDNSLSAMRLDQEIDFPSDSP